MKKMIPMLRLLPACAALAGIVCAGMQQGFAQTSAETAAVVPDARGFLGITLSGQIHESGAAIGEVRAGFPAEQSGLRAGDVIVGFQGMPVDDSQDLYARMRTLRPGDGVSIDYARDGQSRSLRMAAVGHDGRAAPPNPAPPLPQASVVPAAAFAPQGISDASSPAAPASRLATQSPISPPAPVASRASERPVNLDEARTAFAQMDRQDFLDGIDEANGCAARQNYDCTDRALARIKELIDDDDQQKLWTLVQTDAQDGRRLLAQQRAAEEAQRQWEIAEREKQERMEREEEQRQSAMAFMNGLQTFQQTFQSEMQKNAEQQRQQQQFLQGIQTQARAQQEAQRRQREAEAAEQARQRAQQQQAAREALAAQLAAGMVYRNQQIASAGSAAEAQRLQDDNAKAMQAARQIGMADQVSAQANATTQASNAQRRTEQQAEQQRLVAQRASSMLDGRPASQPQSRVASVASPVEPPATSAAEPALAATKPLRFVMMIGMLNLPGDTVNPSCYSNVITRPGPPGWGAPGFLPPGSGEQARQTVLALKSAFIAKCETSSGRKITADGNFDWVENRTSSDEARVDSIRARFREDVSVTMN